MRVPCTCGGGSAGRQRGSSPGEARGWCATAGTTSCSDRRSRANERGRLIGDPFDLRISAPCLVRRLRRLPQVHAALRGRVDVRSKCDRCGCAVRRHDRRSNPIRDGAGRAAASYCGGPRSSEWCLRTYQPVRPSRRRRSRPSSHLTTERILARPPSDGAGGAVTSSHFPATVTPVNGSVLAAPVSPTATVKVPF